MSQTNNKKPEVAFFTAEDFEQVGSFDYEELAHFANAILAERGQVVWGSTCKSEWTSYRKEADKYGAISSNFKESAHTALLINVQEIKKECVEHYPNGGLFDTRCIHCRVKLRVKWEAVIE